MRFRTHLPSASIVVKILLLTVVAHADTFYYPESGAKWKHKTPAEVGMDAQRLEEAVTYAREHESKQPRDFSNQVQTFGRQLGELPKERGGTNGLVIRHGYIVAEWGDTDKVEPTYSAAKSFLSTVCGLAVDRGLIKDVHDPVGSYVHDGGYEDQHNAKIQWLNHLQQTSEWQGTLWDKPDSFLGVTEFGNDKRAPRTLNEPGTYWEYNDVRVNRFSLSLLRVWKRPLPEVLKKEIMDPIGASNTWDWKGYTNSDVQVDGKTVKSVSGGSRWGGGLWISARDEARFGYLFLRKGRWGNHQLISEAWVKAATTRGSVGPDYGYLWWLNTEGKQWPNVPRNSFAAVGAGSNTVWMDPEHDLVVVWRWHQGSGDELFKRVVAAIQP